MQDFPSILGNLNKQQICYAIAHLWLMQWYENQLPLLIVEITTCSALFTYSLQEWHPCLIKLLPIILPCSQSWICIKLQNFKIDSLCYCHSTIPIRITNSKCFPIVAQSYAPAPSPAIKKLLRLGNIKHARLKAYFSFVTHISKFNMTSKVSQSHPW